MKVRDRINKGEVRDVYRTAMLGEGGEYYLFTDGKWGSARCYEPVPTETWRDVTSECEFSERTDMPLGGYALKHNGTIISLSGSHYRLRKERVTRGHENVYAFIVEKKNA
jgi:hypothetical protein